MHWPVGTPKVYALSEDWSGSARGVSHDGLQTTAEVVQQGLSGTQEQSNGHALKEGEQEHADKGGNGSSGDDNGSPGSIDGVPRDKDILAAKISRGGGLFASITRSTLTVWQTKPMIALAAIVRSAQSMKTYGPNIALLMRPDALVIVVETALGYLITYTLATDPNARVYQTKLPDSTRHARKDSQGGYSGYRRPSATAVSGADGFSEVHLRFRMVIRIDAGISKALALDEELIVATQNPAATQSIRWVAESGRSQINTELLSGMQWMAADCVVVEMVHDRPMNLSCWVTNDGKAYAVQRQSATSNVGSFGTPSRGFCFHHPENASAAAVIVAIGARFSLIAIGCAGGTVEVYVVKDYTGNIPLSHKLPITLPATTSGKLVALGYSPDGYALMVGYERGWSLWSVYGKQLASSFTANPSLLLENDEQWLQGVRDMFWIGGGCELAIVGREDERLWVMDMARNACTGCLSPATVSRGLLCSSDTISLYKGHEVTDLTALGSDMSLWQTVQIPRAYLVNQWPIKIAVISSDGRYVAVAGRRGLAHYSVSSGRWRTFEDSQAQDEFSVRGGMCWHHHLLVVSVECGDRHQIRIYSRDKSLERTVCSQELTAPAVLMTTSGADSLLVYTYDNTLLHYIVETSGTTAKLVQVGRIGFHGIIRAPPRVRAISWILPEDQLEHGHPSQDVATASVLFLVDGKLVLLQPSMNEQGELKYDMRVIVQDVEYYLLLRDQPVNVSTLASAARNDDTQSSAASNSHIGHSLRDSLWFFDGASFHVWSDIQDVLACAPSELERDLPPTVRIPMDFYPVSIMVEKGVVHGLDADLVQRRDVNFSTFSPGTRTQLFLPHLLRYHLADYNSPAALHLATSYQQLPYFAHALEILLHDVLDQEVDCPPEPPETALLPTLLAFLSSFPSYLDVIVNCSRKTELRSWRTLFSYLPPVRQLFETALAQSKLKTAAGYLLVLHTFQQGGFQVHESSHLLRLAAVKQDWDLCRELTRFLVGIDSTGWALRAALVESGLRGALEGSASLVPNGRFATAAHAGSLVPLSSHSEHSPEDGPQERHARANGYTPSESVGDYFSLG